MQVGVKYRSVTMDLKSDSVTQKRPHSSSCRDSGGDTDQTVFGFPVVYNQFNELQNNQPAEFQRSTQEDVGLVDPRTTRPQRLAVALRTEDTGTKTSEDLATTVLLDRTAQEIFDRDNVEPTAVGNSSSFFPHSFPAWSPDILSMQSGDNADYMLGTDAGVKVNVGGETLYSEFNCNKRISCAGPERSAGRPGHTPNRRRLACGKLVEDSYAGQE